MALIVENVCKTFGRFPALNGVSMTVREGEFIALLGPSGSGKTTLLRSLAGLEQPDSGSVRFGDLDFLRLSPRERRVGMVFQHYALFKHMKVADNIAFGLTVRPRADRPAKADIDSRVKDLLRLVQLEGLGDRYPSQLSGGQRQRVALARALAIEPRLLLLDEPFGALDAKVRKELRRWLRQVHDETGVTTIFVTHDQEEALELADRVAVLNKGGLEQVGTPDELYASPASPFVFDFLGDSLEAPCQIEGGRARIEGALVDIVGPAPADGPGRAFLRPHDLRAAAGGEGGLPATVLRTAVRGLLTKLECALPDGRIVEVEQPAETPAPPAGARAALTPLRAHVYAA
jgi:sulfate/thiosulfate transport system ATP-binding protein